MEQCCGDHVTVVELDDVMAMQKTMRGMESNLIISTRRENTCVAIGKWPVCI